MSRVVLLGIAEDLAEQLSRVLQEEAHTVCRCQSFEDARSAEPDVVFLSGDAPDLISGLSDIRQAAPALPIVVVTRLPESARWLDALEAGAQDYCGAPFERVQLRWIMDTVCPQLRRMAA